MATAASTFDFERIPRDAAEAFSAAQCRAARGLLNWSQTTLCKASKVGMRTLGDFERETHRPSDHLVRDIRAALETAGIEFFSEDGGRIGVRLSAANRFTEARQFWL
jgi:transcriptional regulator with XRE-family HTH domain